MMRKVTHSLARNILGRIIKIFPFRHRTRQLNFLSQSRLAIPCLGFIR